MSKKGRAAAAVVKTISTKNFFNTVIPAKQATAAPPLGPLLGNFGLNINAFCKAFNEKTKDYKIGIPLPITVKIKPDRSYDIDILTPSITFYLMQAAGITQEVLPDETKSGEITLKHVYEIAKIKHSDPLSKFQVLELEEVVEQVLSLAQDIGLELVKEIDPVKYKEFLDERDKYLEKLAQDLAEKEKLKFQRVQDVK